VGKGRRREAPRKEGPKLDRNDRRPVYVTRELQVNVNLRARREVSNEKGASFEFWLKGYRSIRGPKE